MYIMLAVVFWGLAPIFGKIGLVEVSPLLGLSVRSFGISLLLLLALLLSGEFSGLATINLRSGSFIVAEGVFAGLLGHFAYYYALKSAEVSRVVLLARAAPIITVLVSVLFLHESISRYKLGGMVLIVVGAILMSM